MDFLYIILGLIKSLLILPFKLIFALIEMLFDDDEVDEEDETELEQLVEAILSSDTPEIECETVEHCFKLMDEDLEDLKESQSGILASNNFFGGIELSSLAGQLAEFFRGRDDIQNEAKAVSISTNAILTSAGHYHHMVGPAMLAYADVSERKGDIQEAVKAYEAIFEDFISKLDEMDQDKREYAIYGDDLVTAESLEKACEKLIGFNRKPENNDQYLAALEQIKRLKTGEISPFSKESLSKPKTVSLKNNGRIICPTCNWNMVYKGKNSCARCNQTLYVRKYSARPMNELIYLSSHWDGYKREDAVRELGERGDATVLPELYIRANDWVHEVRCAAKQSIRKLLVTSNVDEFVASLPELYRLKKCYREDHGELISEVINFLLNGENRKALLGGQYNVSLHTSRICFSLVLEKQLLPPEKIVDDFISHEDLVMRLKASSILRHLPVEEQKSAIERTLTDRFMPIRREGVQLFFKYVESIEDIKPFLFDVHPSIREVAIRKLKSIGADAGPVYEKELKAENNTHILKCSIWGVAALRNKEMTPTVAGFLRHNLPSIRKQAIGALVTLQGEAAKESLVSALQDPSPAVSKEARRLIRRYKLDIEESVLSEIVRTKDLEHIWNCCISICREMNKWDRLIFIIKMLDREPLDEDKRFMFKGALDAWDWDFNKSASQPTASNISHLSELWTKHGQSLLDDGYSSVDFTLKSIGVVDK